MATIVLVGDERDRTAGLKSLLGLDGHRVATAKDADRCRELERAEAPEAIVAAVASPQGVITRMHQAAHGFLAPILFVQHASDEGDLPHVEERLVDRIASPFSAEDLLGHVDALVRVRRVVLRHDAAAAEAAGRGLAGRLRAMLGRRVPRLAKPPSSYLEVAARVADWGDRRDGFEPGHAERVTAFSALIADELDLSDAEASSLLRAAMVHDIGKVALPVEVLRRKGPLEEGHLRLLRSHAERGASILKALDPDDEVVDAVLYHHEHVDGSGYFGRKGSDIPLHARILAVAESYDAMTTSMVRKTMTGDAALGLMQGQRGGQWDADCVDALTRSLRPRPRTIALS